MNRLIEIYIKAYRWIFPKMPSEVFYECSKDLELFEKLCREDIMTEKRFVKHYAGRTEKRAIGIKDIETNRVCVTIEENICLLNELADENKELKEENEQLKQQIEELEFKLRTIEAYDRTVKEEHSDTVYGFKKKLEKW